MVAAEVTGVVGVVGVVGVTGTVGVTTGGEVPDVAATVVPEELTPPPPHPAKARQSAAADEAMDDRANLFMTNPEVKGGKTRRCVNVQTGRRQALNAAVRRAVATRSDASFALIARSLCR